MKRLLSGKGRIVFLAGLICVLLLLFIGCARAQAPTVPQPTTAPGAGATIVVPTQISAKTAKTVTIYAAGFVPNKAIVVKLSGTWKVSGTDIVDPALEGGTAIANTYGAAKITGDIAKAITTYKISRGVYTLIAEQGNIVVSAPLEVTE